MLLAEEDTAPTWGGVFLILPVGFAAMLYANDVYGVFFVVDLQPYTPVAYAQTPLLVSASELTQIAPASLGEAVQRDYDSLS